MSIKFEMNVRYVEQTTYLQVFLLRPKSFPINWVKKFDRRTIVKNHFLYLLSLYFALKLFPNPIS